MKDLYKDIDIASQAVDEIWNDNQKNMTSLCKLWERAAAFANGNQMFNSANSSSAQLTGSQFLVSGNQDNKSQMYTTNEIDPILRTLISYLTRERPTVECFSSDDNENSQLRARVADRVMEAKYDIDKEQKNSKLTAYYMLVFGTAIRKDYWDSSAGNDAEIPEYDELGNEVIDPETGVVQTQNQKTGDNKVAILTPLSMGFDWSVTDFEEQPYIIESYLMPIEWAKEMFNKQEPGYTGKAEDIEEGAAIGNSLTTLEQLKYATPFSYGYTTSIKTDGKVLVQECYIKPSYELPKGRLIIKVSGLVVYDSFNKGQDLGSPYFMPYSKIMWHPYSFMVYSPYVGRLLGKGLVESLIPQQMRLNEINGAILTNANTLAKVDILAAENQLKRGVANGSGGMIYTYKPRQDAPPPAKWPGQALPTQFFKEKEQLIEQMVREAGTNMVMQGNAPTGVTAASAIEQLLENANAQQSDLIISWRTFHEEAFTKKLRLIRNFQQLPNNEVVDYIKTIDKDALDLEIKAFVGEDIGDGVNLRIEETSMIPKSQKAKKDFYTQLSQGFFGQFLAEDSPRGEELRAEFFRRIGEEVIETSEQADIQKAKWENTNILKHKPAEVWMEDNHAIHLSCHITEMKKPKFLERAPDDVKLAFQQHVDMHRQMQQQQQMQQMMQQIQQQQMMAPQPQMLPAEQQAVDLQ